MNKILSISVAAYNVEKYLDKLFEMLSISDELNNDIEIIIVNDGSKDNTLKIAKEYKNRYPNSIVIVDKENGGYGSTINASIKIATGKYYKILDGDDWFDKDNLEDFIHFLKASNEDLIISPYTCYYEEINRTEIIDGHNEGELDKKSIAMHEITIKTNLYKNKGAMITENCFYTDTEYALSAMLISNSFIKYPNPVYCYRLGREGQSVSRGGLIKHINDAGKMMIRCIDMYSNQDNKDQRSLIAEFFAGKIRWYYYSLILAYGNNGVNKIVEFDKNIKSNHPEIYRMSSMAKRIKLLRFIKYKPKVLVKYLFTEKESENVS